MNEQRPLSTVEAAAPDRRGYIFVAALLAMFMAAVESTIVATAMPTIVAQLGGFRLFSWVFAIYLLSQAVSIPIYGKLADVYGRKPMLLFGATLFLVGSTLCGVAGDMVQLILFRALQGLGAGSIQPIVFTIIADIYSPTERAKRQGYISSVWGISAILGPAVGGFLVEQLSWRFVFWINLPIGIAAMAMLLAFFHERRDSRRHKIDYVGAILMTLGTCTLMLALVQASAFSAPVLAGLFAVAVASFTLFVWHETRAAEPMLPLKLFRNPVIVVGNAGSLVAGMLLLGITGFLPTYVQGVMGRSPTVAGFALAIMSLGWPIASGFGGRLMVWTSYRFTAILGGCSLLAGALVLVALEPARGPVFAGAGAFLIGVGMGFTTTTFLVATQASVDWNLRGIATSSTIFMRMVGMSMGAAVFGAVLNFSLHRHGAGAADAVNRLMDPLTRGTLPAADTADLTAVIAASLHEVYIIAAVLGVVALGLTLLLPRGLSPENVGGDEGQPRDAG